VANNGNIWLGLRLLESTTDGWDDILIATARLSRRRAHPDASRLTTTQEALQKFSPWRLTTFPRGGPESPSRRRSGLRVRRFDMPGTRRGRQHGQRFRNAAVPLPDRKQLDQNQDHRHKIRLCRGIGSGVKCVTICPRGGFFFIFVEKKTFIRRR